MTERVKLALIGCGGMGRRHLRGITRLSKSSMANLELVAVCDLNDENAQYLADEAQELLGTRPRVFNDMETMVREIPDLGAASVTTDAQSHHKVATAALELGLNVQCEKPIAVTMRGANLIIDAARKAGRVLSVAENFRRDPINRLIKALLTDGAIGTPRLMIETSIGGRDNILITPWRHMKHTGSITLDVGVHNADILRYYMGEFKTVFGVSQQHEKTRRNTGSTGPGGFYGRWSANYPDTIEPTGQDAMYAYVGFESGASGQWIQDHAGHGLRNQARHVYGATGSLECPGDRNGRPVKLHLDDGTVIADEQILEYAPSYQLEPLAAELFGGERVWTYSFDFNDTDSRILALEYYELGTCSLTGAQPEVTGEEARADVALAYAPIESGRRGGPVSLDDLVSGRVCDYLNEVDALLGLVATPASA
ncbi:MAG: Gfo/Idh/MocA family oxidoreductase [Chloroflexi bacterium]|nr:Gfo/Idh/MocA family oxidoreductase [Chloroflexota bacterium]